MPETGTPKQAAQVAQAKRAVEVKAEGREPTHPAADQTSHAGMNPTPNAGIAPSGAFEAEGQRPVLERSRKSR